MLGFISAGIGAILLVVGILALLSAKVRTLMRGLPLVKSFKPEMLAIVFIVVGVIAGGWGVVTSYVSTMSITGQQPSTVDDLTGEITVTLSNGIVNNATAGTTTEDYLNDEEDFMTFYSSDANIDDGYEYEFNVTIERELVEGDANVKLTCRVDDKELSGVTADNLIEKTGGQIDLDFIGATSSGKHSDDNTVWSYVAFSEGTGSVTVEIGADQEETYHDGMTDLDDYVDIECDANGVPFTARVYADS